MGYQCTLNTLLTLCVVFSALYTKKLQSKDPLIIKRKLEIFDNNL